MVAQGKDVFLKELQESLETGHYREIPVGVVYEDYMKDKVQTAVPEYSDDHPSRFYRFGSYRLEVYDGILLTIAVPVQMEVHEQDVAELFGEGDVQSSNNEHVVSYRSDDCVITFNFRQDSRRLTEVSLTSSMFID
ncbi:hypothetical protein Q5741_20605 [Paenibacillus sp. JX-17]|uniref:Uncharacterized protein n=1 Tax=Paenibacillus lacisoli TaxID=3064525 RepID=A0ABT9CHN9_9BACL|nr:hypothetical protein [Paenibacillus sp. JX-17]MDO7908789.1 hypothetical protein [Paenibacillus sp. JX-17]